MSRLKSAATLASVAVLAFCVVPTVFAQSLAQKEKYARVEYYVNHEAEQATYQCKTPISFKFDWSTFTDEILFDNNDLPGRCAMALGQIGFICNMSEEAKKTVQSKVKGVFCKQSPSTVFSLENGIFTWGIDFKDNINVDDKVRAFLMKNL